jgi:peptidase M23-like protein
LAWGAAAVGCLAVEPAPAQDSLARDSLPHQASQPPLSFQTRPAPLTEGTVGWLRVRSIAGARIISGEAAGEPLHFQKVGDTTVQALIAVPVGDGDSLPVSLQLERPAGRDTLSISLPLLRAKYPDEMLSVAPSFARPDSAAAARIQAEIAQSREISRESQARRRLWKEPFGLPRASRITSRFGTGRVFNGEVQSRHLGTDFAGAIGAPVRAAGRGVVALVADFYLAGRAVYIDHGAGLVTGYFHLSRIDVRQGQRVVGGQRIGAVGRSGRVTGPHLHWVARYGAISVDPMSLLQLVSGQR